MDIIKAVLNIEEKAQGIIKTMDALKKESDLLIEEELLKWEESIKNTAKQQVLNYRQEQEKLYKQKIKKLADIQKEKQQFLEETYRDKQEAWIQTITDAVIKGADL